MVKLADVIDVVRDRFDEKQREEIVRLVWRVVEADGSVGEWEFPSCSWESLSSDTNDRPDRRVDCIPDVADATRIGRAVKLDDVESHGVYDARNVRRALIGEHADAPNAWRNFPQHSESPLRSERSRTAGENHSHVRCAERDRELGVLGSRQAAELDLNRHGQSSELPSIAQRLLRRQPPPIRRIQREQRRRRGERRVPRPPVPRHRSRRSR